MHRHGKTTAGNTRYKCPVCRRTATEAGGTHGGYRHGEPGGTPNTEIKRRSRIRKRQNSTDIPE